MFTIFFVVIAIALVYTSQVHARVPVRKNKKIDKHVSPLGTPATATATAQKAQSKAQAKAQAQTRAAAKSADDSELTIKKQRLAGNGNETKPWAYALYATDMDYARVAAINIKRLRTFGNASVSDIVVVVTPSVPLATWHMLRTAGASHIVERSPNWATNVDATWAMSPLKFSIFGLVWWKRVVYIDSDGLVMSRMDHLFHTPLTATHTVAMAPAYWLPEGRVLPPSNQPTATSSSSSSSSSSPIRPFYTTALIVYEPSVTMAAEVNLVFRATHKEDMPVINEALGSRVVPLSHLDVPLVTYPYPYPILSYCILNLLPA